MQLFSIGIDSSDSELKNLIYKRASTSWVEEFDIEENRIGDMIFLNYSTDPREAGGRIDHVRERLQQFIADALSDIILEDIQSHLVERIIKDEYFYFEKEDRDKILRDALAIMWGGRNPIVNSETIREAWRNRVWQRIMDHLNINDELIFDGFIRFRLKDFQKELEVAVDRAVDDLLIENEYNEFIRLLQYFVEVQEPKVDEVHVLQQGDRGYTLLDGEYRVIHNEMLEQLAREISDKEISHDDLLISSLITIAPESITIHEYHKIKNRELLNTIKNVFNGKVKMSMDKIKPETSRDP